VRARTCGGPRAGVRDSVVSASVVGTPHVRLNLLSRPENVLLVRQTLSGLAEAIGLDPIELNDISTAVSEACNNVVLHAYGSEEGPLEVDVCASATGVTVVVRDHGSGIPRDKEPSGEDALGGIGLPVIRALTNNVELIDLAGGGTEVLMEFATTQASPLGPAPDEVELKHGCGAPQEESADMLAMTIGPGSVARAVLPRVLSALAARAHFSTDRIAETQLLADALVPHAEGSLGTSRLNIRVRMAPRKLEMRVGPLRAGSSADGLASVLDALSDGHEVSRTGSSEVLALRLTARQ
jgi:serine/threonine-protein kinase RsbW